MDKKVRAGELPHHAKGVKSGAWQSVVRAAQGNFDHLMGVIRNLVTSFNSLVDDFETLRDWVSGAVSDTSTADHTHGSTGGGENDGGQVDHAGLANLATGDPHTQYRLESADHSHQTTGLQAGTLDHGAALTGLTDDDHSQYLKERLSGGAESEVPGHAHQATASAGTLDHGAALTGLTDDDHTQYLKEKASSGAASEIPEHTHQSAAEAGILDTLAQDFTLAGVISPAQLTGRADDWNPTGLSTAAVIRVSSDAAYDITGLAGGASGRIIIIHNVGSFALTLSDADALSAAANRFALTADVALDPDAVAVLQYDGTTERWRAVSGGGGGAGPHDIISATHTDSTGSPSAGDYLGYDGADWTPVTPDVNPHGTFMALADQTIGSTGTAYAVAFDGEDDVENMTHSTVTNNSRLYADLDGSYLFIFSGILDVSVANKHMNVWLRLNGSTDVTNSNTLTEVVSTSSESTVAVAFIVDLEDGDYVEFMYSGDHTGTKWKYTAAASPAPASPSVIVTACRVNPIPAGGGGGGGGATIIVKEGGTEVTPSADTLDFDASDFNTSESPAGEVNISLNYGTGAGTPAEGNHQHAKHVLVWSSKEAVAELDASDKFYMPYAGTFQDVYFSLPSANTTTTTIDVHKNGTTIYTTQGNRPTCTGDDLSNHATSIDVTSFAQDDYITIHVDTLGDATGRIKAYVVLKPS